MRRFVPFALIVSFGSIGPLLLSGCLLDFPTEDEGPYPCVSEADCASGFACAEGFCNRPGNDAGSAVPDAAAASDAAVDAGEARPDATSDASVTMPDAGDPADAGAPVDAGCDQTWCGDECVNLQTSADHCGQCGRSCLGGACSFGRCLPAEFHRDSSSTPNRVIFEGDTVFWADQRAMGAVLGRKADGTEATFVVERPVRYPTALVAQGDLVGWSALDELGGALRGGVFYERAPFAGAAVPAASDQSNPRGLSVQGGFLYWNSNSPLYIRAHPIGGTMSQNLEVRISTGSSFARDVVTSSTEVIWADAQSNLQALPLDLSSPPPTPRSVLASSAGETRDLLLHDGTLYWGEDPDALQGQGQIFSAPADTGLVTTVVSQAHPDDADQGPVALAFSKGYLYYVTAGLGGRGGGLFRVPHTGGTPEPLAVGAPTDVLRGVAVGAGRIFWTQNDAVYSLPEP